jgi:hypothetical protein
MNDDLDLSRLRQIPDPFAAPSDAPPMRAPEWPSPTRQRVRRDRGIAAVAVVLYEVGWVAFVERRADLASLPPWVIAAGLLVPLVATALAFGAVVARGRRGLGVSTAWLAALSALPPLLFAVVTLAVNPPDPEGEPFWNLVARCIGVSSVLVAIPLALGAMVFRHAFPGASMWRTAALGVACGGLGAATMSLVCRHGGAFHVVLGHGAMMIVGGAVGALLGRRMTRA